MAGGCSRHGLCKHVTPSGKDWWSVGSGTSSGVWRNGLKSKISTFSWNSL